MDNSLAVSLSKKSTRKIVGPILSRIQTVDNKIDGEILQRTTDINNLIGVVSTDTERLASIASLTQAFESADSSLTQTLTTAITNAEAVRQSEDTLLQNQINGNDSDISSLNVQVSQNTSGVSSNGTGITNINSKLGTVSGAEFGVLNGVGTTTSLASQLDQRVALTGNQSISGEKTFTEDTTFTKEISAEKISGSTAWEGSIIGNTYVDGWGTKQDQHSALDRLVLENLSTAELSSLDTTQSIQTQLDAKFSNSEASAKHGLQDALIATNSAQILTKYNSSDAGSKHILQDAEIASKQSQNTHLDSVNTSARTVTQLNSLDTTSSITNQLSQKASVSTTITNSQITNVGSGLVITTAERTRLVTTHPALHTTHASQIAANTSLANTKYSTSSANTKHSSLDALISTNTDKISYSDSSLVAAHTSDIATNAAEILTKYSTSSASTKHNLQDALISTNTDKISYSDSSLVASHTSDIATNAAEILTQEALISTNTDKISFDTVSSDLLATHVNLHTAHSTALATKLNSSGNQTMDGRLTVQNDGNNGTLSNSYADDLNVCHYNDVGITLRAPEGKIGSIAFSDQNKADRNLIRGYSTVRDSRNIGVHTWANQLDTAVPSMSVCTQLVGINKAQPTVELDCIGAAKFTGNVNASSYKVSGVALQLSDLSDDPTDLIGTKLNSSGNQTMDGRLTVQNDGANGTQSNSYADDLNVCHYNDVGITLRAPMGKIGSIAFSDQNKADRNLIRGYSTVRDSRNIGVHTWANQLDTAVPTMSVCTQTVGINVAQPVHALDCVGSVRFVGLPTLDIGLSVGQLWISGGNLKIKT